jgi:hypothetical protein
MVYRALVRSRHPNDASSGTRSSITADELTADGGTIANSCVTIPGVNDQLAERPQKKPHSDVDPSLGKH